MDDSIQHLEQEQPVHERAIETQDFLSKIKDFVHKIDTKRRYIILVVVVLIIMQFFTLPFLQLIISFIFTQTEAIRNENIQKYNAKVDQWNIYQNTLVNYTINIRSLDTNNVGVFKPVDKNVTFYQLTFQINHYFPDDSPNDNFTRNFKNLVWTSNNYFAYSKVNENVDLEDSFQVEITVKSPLGIETSKNITLTKFRYQDLASKNSPFPIKFTSQSFCLIMDVKKGEIIQSFGCNKEQGQFWSQFSSVQYSGAPKTYPCEQGSCVHEGSFSIRDINDPFCQIYYILGNNQNLTWGTRYEDKIQKIILFLALGGVFYVIFFIIFGVIGFFYYKHVVQNEGKKEEHHEPYFSQE